MIEDLFIVLESGICLFHWSATNQISLDHNLVSGFLSAIMQFSEETFQESRLETVNISNKKKIVAYLPAPRDLPENANNTVRTLKFFAIVHVLDHVKLVNKILSALSKAFFKMYDTRVVDLNVQEVSHFDGFNEVLENLTRGRIYQRSKFQSRLGLGMSITIIVAPLLILLGLVLPDLRSLDVPECLNLEQILRVLWFVSIMIALVLFMSGLIGGYVAGSRRHALRGGIRLTGIIIITLLFLSIRNGYIFLLASLVLAVYFLLILLGSHYLGGFLRDIQYLYPASTTTAR